MLTLVLCPAADGRPLLNINNTQVIYQAEEHSNVTLTLLSPVNTTSESLYIDVMNVEQKRCIYRYDRRVQADPYTDDVFRDRLQCDPQLVGNREIHCFLTDLRLSDAGIYQWFVAADGRSNLNKWELVVRAVLHQTQKEPPRQTGRGRVGLYMALCLFAVVISVCFL